MPKKSKPIPSEENSSAPAKTPRARSTSTKKKSAKKSSASGKTKATKVRPAAAAVEPTDEEIQLRAYFIAERRHRLDLHGDTNSDWLEAKRQLVSELGPR